MVDLPIDYTSRDFTSIRADMIDQIAARLPEWTSRSPNDFGIVLIEMFAHIADSMHYYADRVANECFLSTATQRSSVLEIAKLLDYRPDGNGGAVVSLAFVNNTGSPVTIPFRTRVGTTASRVPTTPGPGRAYLRSSAASVLFETTTALTVPANSSAPVLATEGIGVVGEAVATSDGTPDQDWDLYYAPVIDGSITVYVNGVKWQPFQHLIDADFDSPAYNTSIDALGYTHLLFGDDVNGEIPVSGAAITCDYRVGGGSIGNVVAGTLTRALTPIPAGVTVTNVDDAIGGSDADTIAAIKANAPRSLYTLDRAVSAKDYAQLALRVQGVGKAVLAPQSTYNSAVLYIAPASGGGYNTDNVTPSDAWYLLRDDVVTYMVDRIPASTTLTVLPPTYVTINGIFNVVVDKSFPLEATRIAVYPAIAELLKFENVSFGDTLSQADFLAAVTSVPGVKRATIQLLAPNAPNAGQVVIEAFDVAAPGTTGWTVDTTVGVQANSFSRSSSSPNIGTVFRTFGSPIDLSGTGAITLRYTYDGGPPGGMTGTLSLSDGTNTFQCGTRHAAIGNAPFTHTSFHTVRWGEVTWPDSSAIFDATHVVSYNLVTSPNGAAVAKYWLDDLRAIPYLIEDIALAYNDIPTTGGDTLSTFSVYATRG